MLELSLITFPWYQPSVLLNYQSASCPWQYQHAISTQSIIVRHTPTHTDTHSLAGCDETVAFVTEAVSITVACG